MKNDLNVVQEALDAAPTCEGLVWGTPEKPSDPREGTFPLDLSIRFKGRDYPFPVHVRGVLSRVALERVINLKCVGKPFILVSAHVSASQAEILRRNEIAFLDAAGNVSLDLPGLHLFVVGKGRPVIREVGDPSRIFSRTGSKLLFAFLADPNLDRNPENALVNQTFRAIRHQTDVALGSIGAVLGSLVESEYIIEDEGVRFLVERRRLFEKWVAAYVDRLRPKLIIQRYRSRGISWWNSTSSLGDGNFWGGEVAAAKLTGYLKPELTTIYSRGDIRRLILDADLRPDPKGDVEVLKAFWGEWPHGSRGDCAHPLLVYADLVASDIDRNIETAQRVYDRHLRDIIEPRG